MFGFFKKKEEPVEIKEEFVDLSDIRPVDAEEMAAIKDEEIATLKLLQANKDKEQDKYIKEMEEKILKLTNTVKELREVDKQFAKTDSNQNARLKEMARNYIDVKNKVDSLDVRTQITVKNVKSIKNYLTKIDTNKLTSNEKDCIEKSLLLIDNIVKRFA